MQIARIIHEGGLTTYSLQQSRMIDEQHSLRPVLLIESRPIGNLDLLLGENGSILGIQASRLYSSLSGEGLLFLKIFALAYDVGATLHHCVNLAKTYESIVVDHKRISSIPGLSDADSEYVHFSNRSEPYYELDALLSAARRVYDKIGHCVWHAFENHSGGMPDNLAKILLRLKGCPAPLAERLENSWSTVGQKLKAYRDCTQHFASTDGGLCTVMMQQLRPDMWRASARIPDNPEAKSKNKFTYVGNLDALKYGWSVVNEVVALAAEVATATSQSVQNETNRKGND